MTGDPSELWPPIHQDELLPALRAIVRLQHGQDRRTLVQVAGINGDAPSTDVARALAEFVQTRTRIGVRLVTCDSEGLPEKRPDRDGTADVAKRESRRGTKGLFGPTPSRLRGAAPGAAILDGFLPVLDHEPDIGLVILDTAPVLHSLAASGVAAQVDGVILVVSATGSSLRDISGAIATVRLSGGTLLGLILIGRRYRVPRWLARMLGLPYSRSARWTKDLDRATATAAEHAPPDMQVRDS